MTSYDELESIPADRDADFLAAKRYTKAGCNFADSASIAVLRYGLCEESFSLRGICSQISRRKVRFHKGAPR
jgi:hypothetical protein